MFKIIFTTLKIAVFAAIVLALGNWIEWRGQTLSDQVRTGMAQASRVDWQGKAKNAVNSWVETAKSYRAVSNNAAHPPKAVKAPAIARVQDAEDLTSSERQKLRNLIRELNGN